MSTAHQVKLVLPQEGEYDLLPEDIADSPLRFPPHLHLWVRISPQQIAEQPHIRNIGWPDDGIDLLN